MAMHCTNCGVVAIEGARFCGSCGTAIAVATPAAQGQPVPEAPILASSTAAAETAPPRRTDPFAPRPRNPQAPAPVGANAAAGGFGAPPSTPLTFSEHEIALARSKSYTGHAVICLILGFILWFPGLIATIVFRNEATRNQQIAGQSLPGVGCLTAMLWYYALTALAILLVIVIVAGSL